MHGAALIAKKLVVQQASRLALLIFSIFRALNPKFSTYASALYIWIKKVLIIVAEAFTDLYIMFLRLFEVFLRKWLDLWQMLQKTYLTDPSPDNTYDNFKFHGFYTLSSETNIIAGTGIALRCGNKCRTCDSNFKLCISCFNFRDVF